jgi:thermitase
MLGAMRTLLVCSLLSLAPCVAAAGATCNPSDDPATCHAGRAEAFRGDRLIFKLTPEAARRAEELPELTLPRGLPELDVLLGLHGLAAGRRVVRQHGTPIGDRALFERIGLDRTYVVHLPRSDTARVRELVRLFRAQPWVEYAEPVHLLRTARTVPNDPRFSEQWPPDNTGQTGGTPDADLDGPEAWDVETGDASVIVAVLDSGADQDHEDLIGNLVPGFDFGDDDNDPEDPIGHGTQAAGLVAARGNNATGVAGLCWTCSIMPLKVFADTGASSDEILADAIRYAADNGASVISMSLQGYPDWSQTLVDAVDYAHGLGTVSVSAAGNEGTYRASSPAFFPNVVSVGATDHDDVRFLNYGDHAELSAPGLSTLTTDLEDTYSLFSGTSAACPHAAGVAGLLVSNDPGLHVNELRYLLRLGAEDGVGAPSEDTPGWDSFMGFGRVNANDALAMIDGPWLALDRPHFVCAGQLTVALKDETAGSSVDVTLGGDVGGDTETVTVIPVTTGGYYEGSIPLSWTGVDGPVTIGDGSLDVQDGETITASVGALSATAFMDCAKRVCLSGRFPLVIEGDCDRDGAADPGELWSLALPLVNNQTERMEHVVAVLSTADPAVELLNDTSTYGDVSPIPPGGALPDDDGSDDPLRLRVRAGAPAATTATFDVTIRGYGWAADDTGCAQDGDTNGLTLTINRDLGSQQTGWDFDDGTAQGLSHALAHGSGDLPECELEFGSWTDEWNDLPVSDRSHSGAFAMRLGNGVQYTRWQDAGLITPAVTVDPGGGALGFYLWMEAEPDPSNPRLAEDALIVEGKRVSETTWSYLSRGTYNASLTQTECVFFDEFPFGVPEQPRVLSGDGAGTDVDGDTFDRQHQVDLSAYADDTVQVRFRFGSKRLTSGVGVWIDTVSVHGPYTADTWPGDPPQSTGIVDGVEYFYAVEATQSGTGCPTERRCLAGGCSCPLPADPADLRVERDGNDLILSWDDPGPIGVGWNVYRDASPDPAVWGAPHAGVVADEDSVQPGIQYRDAGAVQAGSPLHYRVTAVSGCGESALN